MLAIATRQVDVGFYVLGRDQLVVDDAVREPWRIAIHDRKRVLHQLRPLAVPIRVAQLVRCHASLEDNHVLAFGRERRVRVAWHVRTQERFLTVPAELCVVKRALQELRRWADVAIGRIFHSGSFLREPLVPRQSVNRAKQLETHATRSEAPDIIHEVLGQMRFVDHVKKRPLGVGIGHDARCLNLLSRTQAHSASPAIPDEHLLDPGVAAHDHPMRLSTGFQRIRDRPHPALAERHARLPDQVCDQVKCRPRAVGSDISANRRPEHELGPDQVVLKPSADIVMGAHRQSPNQVVGLLFRVAVSPGKSRRLPETRKILAEGIDRSLELKPSQNLDR